MKLNESVNSILIADCGTATTRVLLIERINNRYRIAGSAVVISSQGGPWFDISVAVMDGIQQIQHETGWYVIDEVGAVMSPQLAPAKGVDLILALTSAAEPLTIDVVGLTKQLSLYQADQAIQAVDARINQQISGDDITTHRTITQMVSALSQSQANLILLVGGFDDGATEPILDLARVIALALQVKPSSSRPVVLFAGNLQLRPSLAEVLADLTKFIPVDNICPEVAQSTLTPLQAVLSQYYTNLKIPRLAGAEKLQQLVDTPLMPAAQSFSHTIDYIGQQHQVFALGADVGSRSTTLAARNVAFNTTTIGTDIGVGQSASNWPTHLDWATVQHWLPLEMSEADFHDFAWHKSLFPASVPQTQQDMWLEMILVRNALRAVLKKARLAWANRTDAQQRWFNWDLIIGSGFTLTEAVPPELAALALLDGLEPVGISRLLLDKQGICRMLGSLATIQPLVAAQIIEDALKFAINGPLLNLGMVIAPMGVGQFGRPALKISVEYGDGRDFEMVVDFGALEIIPLAVDETARIKIQPTKNFSLTTSWDQAGRTVEANVNGGFYGLIIDARGRPIAYAQDNLDNRRQLRNWISSLKVRKTVVNIPQQQVEYDLV